MTDTATISRPEVTMPEAEAALVRAAYEGARCILEYGSGGSTVMAAEMPGKRVWSVESDEAWAQMMHGWFTQNPPASGTEVDVLWVDIGPTKEWGHPANPRGYKTYAQYPLGVWDIEGFEQPDVVLVDGRFRTGCAMAAALRSTKPVRLLFDDYRRRTAYHRVEKYLGTPRITGRMAEFELTPQAVDAGDLLDIIDMMIRP